jgi:hypothetical protein
VDQLISRTNHTNFESALQLITPPAAAGSVTAALRDGSRTNARTAAAQKPPSPLRAAAMRPAIKGRKEKR